MSRYRYHIFSCINKRSADDPKGSCSAKGAEHLQELFKSEVKRRGLQSEVRANKAGCLDACELGPVVVIYPEGVWYRIRTDQDVLDVMNEHIGHGRIVDRLVVRFDGGSAPA